VTPTEDTSDVLTVGITGSAGSGKSTVARIWHEQGVEVVDADELAREVVDRNPGLRQQLAIEFGDDVLEPSAGADVGRLRRQELARRAFESPERTRALNRLVHPPLLQLFRQRLHEAHRRAALRARSGEAAEWSRTAAGDSAADAFPGKPASAAHRRSRERAPAGRVGLVAVDAALIFELGVEELFDEIVVVTAPLDVRVARLRARGLDDATLQGLAGRQIPDAEKIGLADHVLVNDASMDHLRAKALDLLARISPSRASVRERSPEGASPAPRSDS
jgi:dephospho-CoA kinase